MSKFVAVVGAGNTPFGWQAGWGDVIWPKRLGSLRVVGMRYLPTGLPLWSPSVFRGR